MASRGVDAIRFYMVHEMPYASDGNYSEELLIDAYNTNLANVIGNLVNRTIAMANKYFDGNIINDAGNSFSSFRYGISGDFSYEYTMDKIMAGIDVGGQAIILPFSGDDGTILGEFDIVQCDFVVCCQTHLEKENS